MYLGNRLLRWLVIFFYFIINYAGKQNQFVLYYIMRTCFFTHHMHLFAIVNWVACSSLMGYPVHRYIVSISVWQRNRLGELAESLLSDLKTAIVADGDSKTHGSFIENLEIVHQLQDSVTEYITRLFASGNLTEQQSEQTAGLLYVNNSIQRIADRCEDIDQICEKVNNNGKRLTSEASSEMEDCIDIIQQLLKKAMEAIRKGDAVVAETVFENKKKMHKAEKKYSKAHLNRVKNEVCDASMTRYFSGIMYNFDRMADNCVSIAEEACDNVAFINLDEETGKSMMERGAV